MRLGHVWAAVAQHERDYIHGHASIAQVRGPRPPERVRRRLNPDDLLAAQTTRTTANEERVAVALERPAFFDPFLK